MSAWGIDLLRHGEAEGGARFRGSRDDPLTATGWEQMREAVRNRGPWVRLVSSPLLRCRAFAEHLAETLALPLEIDGRLAEIQFGEWEGRSYGELMLTSPLAVTRFFQDPLHHAPPGGEKLADFQARVIAARDDLVSRSRGGERVLAVTHGGVIRVLLCQARGWPPRRLGEIEVPHGSIHSL